MSTPGEEAAESRWLRFARSPRGRAFRAFRHREFRLVWLTFIVGNQGFWISFIAFQALMARLTDTDESWLGLLFFANFVPMLIITPFAGVLADRSDRRRILVRGNTIIGCLVLGLGVLTLAGVMTPIGMLPFAFGIGTVFAFNSPASHAIVANAVPLEDLASAISLQSVGVNLSRVVGPIVAAPILLLSNEGAAFLIYAATSFAVVTLLWRLELSQHRPEVLEGSYWERLRAGVDHARERPPAVAALSMLCVSSLFAGAYLAFLPVIADDVFGRPDDFTVLAVATGVGALVGAFTTGMRVGDPTLSSVALLVAGFGASVAAFGTVTSWNLALVAVAVVGFLYFSAMTTLNTLLQSLADDEKRGRLMSLFVVGWAGLVPVGGLWQGALSRSYGIAATAVVGGLVTAVYATGVLVRSRHHDLTVPRWRVADAAAPRILLVERDARSAKAYERRMRLAGYDEVLRCPGPGGPVGRFPFGDCPLLRGGSCPLADQADVVVFDLAPLGTAQEIVDEYASRFPDRPLIVPWWDAEPPLSPGGLLDVLERRLAV